MYEFLTFRKMITPRIIQALFWLGIAVCVILGLVLIVAGAIAPYGGGWYVLGGLLFILFGPLLVRISCEIIIVVFQILEVLHEISDKTGPRRSGVEYHQRGSPERPS